MSTPSQQDLVRAADAAAAALERLEDRVAGQVSRRVAGVVQPLIRQLTRLWVLAFGGVDGAVDAESLAQLVAAARRAVRQFGVDPRPPVRDALAQALALGVTNAARPLGRRGIRPPAASRDLRRAIATMTEAVTGARDLALERLAAVGSWSDIATVFGALTQAQHRSEATARWVVVRAVAEGTTHAAREAGADLVWVAERTGACLECLAYQGHVVHAGERFPGGLTFRVGRRKRFPDPIVGPPRHPRCRCHVQPWRGQWAGADTGVSFVDALRREAQRAVLRGDAGDSNPARLSAADRLLQAGTTLPVSVRDRARRAVAAGEFPDRSQARPTRTGAR